jgi:hypothetical protein
VSRMGDRFLVLEETAHALGSLDPALAQRFRLANGLPAEDHPDDPVSRAARGSGPADARGDHRIELEVGERSVRCACSCGAWATEVDAHRIDHLVRRIRAHLGSAAGRSDDGLPSGRRPAPPDRLVG